MATAASKIAPPPIRKHVPVMVETREPVLKKRRPQWAQVGEEKLLTDRQLGHCLMKNPLQGSAIGPQNGLNIPKIPPMLSSSQDSISYAYQLIPGLFGLQAKLTRFSPAEVLQVTTLVLGWSRS